MKHGSLINHLNAQAVDFAAPEIGQGGTVSLWTDRQAVTVIAWDPVKMIVQVQVDHAQRTDNNGMSDCQGYEYSPNPNGQVYRFKQKDGRWRQMWKDHDGRLKMKAPRDGNSLRLGYRNAYYDYSF